MLKKIVSLATRQITVNKQSPLTSTDNYIKSRLTLILHILVNKFEENDLTYPAISDHLMLQLTAGNRAMKNFCLKLLIYLHQNHIKRHNETMFQVEGLTIPREITLLVDSFPAKRIQKILRCIHDHLKWFLVDAIKHQDFLKKDDKVLIFLLLSYYPCVLHDLSPSTQGTLDYLTDSCHCNSEELISAVISCVGTFLQHSDNRDLKYTRLINLLVESASPAAREFRRLAVSEFLTRNHSLCSESLLIGK